jgi:hypothetical protein
MKQIKMSQKQRDEVGSNSQVNISKQSKDIAHHEVWKRNPNPKTKKIQKEITASSLSPSQASNRERVRKEVVPYQNSLQHVSYKQ